MRSIPLAALACLFCWSNALADDAWSIGPRKLPPPAGASAQLRENLAKMPAPKSEKLPKNEAGWKEYFAKGDAEMASLADKMAAEHNLHIDEGTIGGVHYYQVSQVPPNGIAPAHAGQLFVNIHGGGFTKGAGRASLPEALEIAAFIKIPVIAIDYRMAPDHPAPAAMDDVIAVWREVLKQHPAASVALGGTSAGGNLTLVATMRMKELGLPLSGALMIGTPAADLAKRGDSRFINEGIDHVVPSWDGEAAQEMRFYAAGASYDDPHLSPIYGDFRGFPPSYLISGTRDLLLSDTVRVHRKLREAGVEADLHVYEGVAHADYLLQAGTPEQAEHFRELDAFLTRHLATGNGKTRSARAATGPSPAGDLAPAARPASSEAAKPMESNGNPPASDEKGLLGKKEPNAATKRWRSVSGTPGRR